jgi:hypothetical protein
MWQIRVGQGWMEGKAKDKELRITLLIKKLLVNKTNIIVMTHQTSYSMQHQYQIMKLNLQINRSHRRKVRLVSKEACWKKISARKKRLKKRK